MYIIYENHGNGTKFQRFLTQMVRFGWGNWESTPAGCVRVGKVCSYTNMGVSMVRKSWVYGRE